MQDGSPYLSIAGVSKSFGDVVALRDISLDIGEGEFVCFLGPSGCGKTTLLRAIAGLEMQSAGAVFQAGRDISALAPSQRDFGIVFQSYALFPNLTVRRNVAYGLESRRLGRAAIRDRVAEMLELVGLTGTEDRYPAQLSGGQQQRVALARALAVSPGLLLLDEPLSALDARVRNHLRHEIKALQRRLGVTTIMVTHDQEEALTMGDRIVVMNHGRIEQVGTPEAVYRDPANAFVADFVGSMNFIEGTVTAGDRVRVGGIELSCETIPDTMAAGSRIAVCIRPEDIVVRGVEDVLDNVVSASLDGLEFLGAHVRGTLGIGGGVTLEADFSINAMRDLALRQGDRLTVHLPGDRLHVFAAEARA
jgi:iron(III) transport system ATP-binding protein